MTITPSNRGAHTGHNQPAQRGGRIDTGTASEVTQPIEFHVARLRSELGQIHAKIDRMKVAAASREVTLNRLLAKAALARADAMAHPGDE